MGLAASQCYPLDLLTAIAKSYCRYRGRLPCGLPRERRSRIPEKGENVDAT
jgi:hypothetical protein